MEHLRQLQLTEDPFRSDPLEKFDVSLASQRDALARLDRGVRQGRGLLLLVGPSGAGKTRVARWLFESLEEEVFEATMLVVLRRRVGADWLLPRLARQLGVESPQSEREALIGQIYERLAIVHEDGRRAVLIIDDAHALADPETLSEVCGLVKLEYEERRLMSVVLVGGPALDAAIAADPQLAFGADVRVALGGLPREESERYLQSRIAVAGGPAELLLPGAVAALHEGAEGAPGRLNILADNALFEAGRDGRSQVTRADVEHACAELGWSGGERLRAASRASGAAVSADAPSAASAQAERTDPMVGPESRTALMDFDADAVGEPIAAGSPEPGTPAQAEATVVAFSDAEGPEPPPKDEGDLDDLFMELLDD